MIIGIVAVSYKEGSKYNWGIGKNNGLLFTDLKKDMQHFKETTSGHTVACGYNTLLSFPNSKPLPNRKTIVLAPEGIERDDCIVAHSFQKMLAIVSQYAKTEDVYIIGGGMFYSSMLPYYDKVLVTKVEAEDSEATVFFPDLDKDEHFEVKQKSELIMDGNYNIQFLTYQRKETITNALPKINSL